MRRSLLALGFMPVVFCSGCHAFMKVGDSRYAPLGGTLRSLEAAPYEAVVNASYTAMKQLELRPDQRERDGFRAVLVGETNLGRLSQTHEIRVWIKKQPEYTEVTMRISGRRDPSRLRAILAEVRKVLANSGQPALANSAQPR